MTPAEYIQLKAFARVDGAVLSLLWTAAFACFVAGLANGGYSMVAMLLIASTPFFVGKRLKRFRDDDLGGNISLLRGWAYAVHVCFYAGLLLALVQYAYFAYIDQGYMMHSLRDTLATPMGKVMLEQYGLEESIDERLALLEQMRPIDYALNMLSMDIMVGILLGLPIALLLKKEKQVPNKS